MKKPQLLDIPSSTPDASVSAPAPASTPASAPQKKRGRKPTGAVKKTFSLNRDDLAYIEKLALKRGQKRGKSMNDSEALRVIIEEHRGQ